MRHIVLSDDGYRLADNAAHRLMAACFFPESPRDQAQGIYIAALEQEEFRRTGPQHYRPSELMLAANRLLEKRSAQLYAVGFIALCYLYLSKTPYRASLNRASIIASYSAGEFGKVTWRSGLDPDGKEKTQAVIGDPASLESLFRRYRSAAHICAARVSAGGYLDDVHIWEETPVATEAFIQTAVTFQDALERATDTSTWNLWDLKKHYPTSLTGSSVLVPDDDLLHLVEQGYRLALNEGKIVNPNGGDDKRPPG